MVVSNLEKFSLKDKVGNYDNLLEFQELSNRAVDEHDKREKALNKAKENTEITITENYERVYNKYKAIADKKVNAEKKVLLFKIVICLIFAVVYAAGVLWFFKNVSLGDEPAVFIVLISYGTVMAIAWLISLLSEKASTKVKVILGVLTFCNVGMVAGFLCLILFFFLREDFTINLEISIEDKAMKKIESNPEYIKEISEAKKADEVETKRRRAEAKEKYEKLRSAVGGYEWLYKAWCKIVKDFRKSYSFNGSDSDLIKKMIKYIGNIYPHVGTITVKMNLMPSLTHNVFEGTYEQLMLYLRFKAENDYGVYLGM